MIRAAAGEEHAWRREIHFDQVGNIDGRDIGPVVLEVAAEQLREFRVERILAKEFRVIARTGATVAILVLDRDEGFVKERVALTPNLYPRAVFPVFAAAA